MTLKIETTADGRTARVRLIGRIDAEHLEELRAELLTHWPHVVLDLDQVTLVDVAVVHLLNDCKEAGIELVNLAPYISNWMQNERAQTP